jgi:hypothetical protein
MCVEMAGGASGVSTAEASDVSAVEAAGTGAGPSGADSAGGANSAVGPSSAGAGSGAGAAGAAPLSTPLVGAAVDTAVGASVVLMTTFQATAMRCGDPFRFA